MRSLLLMNKRRYAKVLLAVLASLLALIVISDKPSVWFSSQAKAASAEATFKQYCATCHSGTAAKAGVNFAQLMAQPNVAETFQQWEKVAAALEEKSMPPKAMPQPSDAERTQAVTWIRATLRDYATKHDGDPGPVTVRRMTSGEYAYALKDLTGLELNVGIDSSSDAVGGEGFTNFGDVQFMQDANLERYLSAAKQVAEHAVIGAGPLAFFERPGTTGFEMSAVDRLHKIYSTYGFRSVSGEGGRPFGLEKYGKALLTAWRFKHRASLGNAGGEAKVTLKELAAREGITATFAEHIWQTMNNSALGYPSSEVAARWRKVAAPSGDKQAAEEAARKDCEAIQKFLVTWPSWLFARGDVAAGGAGDESPMEFSDRTLNVKAPHRFMYVRGGGRMAAPAGPTKIYLNVAPVNPATGEKPLVIWRNLTVGFVPIVRRSSTALAAGESVVVTKAEMEALLALRKGILPPGARKTLREIVSPETAAQLKFGQSPDGTPLGPNDFATEGSAMIEVPMPEGAQPMGLNFEVHAEPGKNREQVVRIVISDNPSGMTRGLPTRALVGDMTTAGYKAFRTGVEQLVALLPPNSHGEPTPADKDPVPDPFDNTYNVPEHDEFVQRIKYIRDDKFFAAHLIDDATRTQLNQAWNDLFASFEYHDSYLRLLAKHYSYDLKGKDITKLDKAAIAALPSEMQKYAAELRRHYDNVMTAQAVARPRHVNDAIDFAAKAWRRPLTESEKLALRGFYDKTLKAELDHRKALRALIARVLVAPQFLYRVELGAPAPSRAGFGLRDNEPMGFVPASARDAEQAREGAGVPSETPLTNWEMASRLSFFLWASLPDDELRRAANAGELVTDEGIKRQVKRMLADPKARRLSTEFFGQWLGFYHFDEFKGVDTSRFTEFTDDVRAAMYDEAVSFFEYIVRKERPLGEMLTADYTFLNKDLAKFYGVKQEVKSAEQAELVTGANAFQRGGLLRLGAVLTATSAPLRTSPVKRGDWILRRILGTPTPPPPADAGSLPADDKMFGGLSLKAKLEQHKRNATCANCHTRIDPLGFSLERYDSTGRWREKYADGNAIEDSATLSDKTEVAGVTGLLNYLQSKDAQVRKTMAYKLVGYALGRTVLASDQLLIERMVNTGNEATMAQLATAVATSKQFRFRRSGEERPANVKSAVNTAMK